MNQLVIAGIDKATLLAALHNGTRAVGMGALHDLGREMTREEAAEWIATRKDPNEFSVDYVYGRPIKVSFMGDVLLRSDLYDRDAPGGVGTCKRIVEALLREAP